MLELMPPEYRPALRTGIVGIGDPAVLDWFVQNFPEDPRPEMEKQRPDPEMLTAIERQFGQVEFPPPVYPIEYAARDVGAILSLGIQNAGGDTVDLPIQLVHINSGVVRQLSLAMFKDLTKPAREITIDHKSTALPPRQYPRAEPHRGKRSAVQLFA
jgi:hypothetical protein